MTEQKFKEISIIKERLEATRQKILIIDSLLTSGGLNCDIKTITPIQNILPYRISENYEAINDLLNTEKQTLQKQLTELEHIFEEM